MGSLGMRIEFYGCTADDLLSCSDTAEGTLYKQLNIVYTEQQTLSYRDILGTEMYRNMTKSLISCRMTNFVKLT